MHQEPREKIVREVVLPETITIQDLASRMSERAVDVVKFFMKQGQIMKPGDVIDADTAELVASEFGHTVSRVAESDIEEGLFNVADKPEDMESRPPVVTIMGHVDHGKTSLLDAIRNANVVAGEAGGITQHIGAYQVEKNGQKITFIDTPGHAAFTAMRARGAQATDIAILVVAADDSVMPQTIEFINHAKAAGVPIIVAINKIDKPQANRAEGAHRSSCSMRSWSNRWAAKRWTSRFRRPRAPISTSCSRRSCCRRKLLDLKANPNRTAEGVVIEAKLDKGRGPVATVLIQAGIADAGRHRRCRQRMGPCSRAGQRPRRADPGSAAVHAGRDSRPARARRRPATASRSSTTRRAPARSPSTGSACRARRRWPSMSASAARSSR